MLHLRLLLLLSMDSFEGSSHKYWVKTTKRKRGDRVCRHCIPERINTTSTFLNFCFLYLSYVLNYPTEPDCVLWLILYRLLWKELKIYIVVVN